MRQQSPSYILIIVTVSIFVAELFTMSLLSLIPPQTILAEALIDGMILTILVSPLLFIFLFRPLKLYITEIRRVEEFLSSVIDSSADAIVTTNAEGVITTWSRGAEELYGYNVEKIVGRSVDELYPEDLKEKRKKWQRSITKGTTLRNITTKIYNSNGDLVDIDVSLAPLKDESGKIIGTVGVSKDITERKLAEEALRTREKQLADSQKVARLGSWEWDVVKNKIIWSDELYRLFGLNPLEFKATYEAFLDMVHPDDRKALDNTVKASLYEKKAYNVDARIIRPDGKEWIMQARGKITYDKSGNPILMEGTAQDITERKQAEMALLESEEKYRTLIESSSDCICHIDLKGNIIYINPGGVKLNELESFKDVCGLDCILAVKEEYKDLMKNALERARKGKTTSLEYESTTAKEKDRWWESIVGPIKDDKGNVASLIRISRDITERRRAEEQIKASLREKEVLLREIHHRVKNNMQIISSMLNLQSRQIKDKGDAEIFKESQNRIKSMALIHEKLYQSPDLANIEFGGYIKNLVNGLFRTYGIDIERIALKMDVEKIPLKVDAAIPCGLLINELVSNSLKYAFPKGREGEIKICLRSIDENEIELVVSDDGVSIPKDLDFRNTESLGLHLVTILAEDQLQGKIKLDRDKGTKFQIRFSGVT